MHTRAAPGIRAGMLLGLACVLVACAAPSSAPSSAPASPGAGQSSSPVAQKTIVIGMTAGVQAMGVMGNSTTAGGWQSLNEIHSDGLITSDVHARTPIGRLAATVPNLDDGSIALRPDGHMRVVYHLRSGITWQDGAPFTSRDLAFSYTFNKDKGLPTQGIAGTELTVLERIESVEAPDDATFVINFKA